LKQQFLLFIFCRFRSTAFEINVEASKGRPIAIGDDSMDDFWGSNGAELGFKDEVPIESLKKKKEGVSRKRKIQEVIVDEDVEIRNDIIRANLSDTSKITLPIPRPNLTDEMLVREKATELRKTDLYWMLRNPATDNLESDLIKYYQYMLKLENEFDKKEDRKRNKKKKLSSEDSTWKEKECVNNDNLLKENWDNGDVGFEGDNFYEEPTDVLRCSRNTVAKKRVPILDNGELSSILLKDDNQSQTQMSNDVSQLGASYTIVSSRKKTASMQRKTWKMLAYIRTKMPEERAYNFTEIAATQDPTLISLCFYQMLVLATNDFIKVEQDIPFGRVKIQKSANFFKDY
jgi:hypothetical protein